MKEGIYGGTDPNYHHGGHSKLLVETKIKQVRTENQKVIVGLNFLENEDPRKYKLEL